MSLRRIVCHLALCCASVACHQPQRGFGRCIYIPADTLPLRAVGTVTGGPVGELRIIALLRDASSAFHAALQPLDSTSDELSVTVTTDSIAVFHRLRPGRYSLRLSALMHTPRTLFVDMPVDSGRILSVPLRYGGVGICEDGIATSGPWWKLGSTVQSDDREPARRPR